MNWCNNFIERISTIKIDIYVIKQFVNTYKLFNTNN